MPEFMDPMEEGGPLRTPRQILARFDYTPLPSTEVSDQQVPGRLWELLYAAAARRWFFRFTNHLSDRELYELLSGPWLDEPLEDIDPAEQVNTRIDASQLGPGWEARWLKYYADEDTRQAMAAGGVAVPPHEDPPYDRDRLMPEPPMVAEGWNGDEEEADSFDEDLDEDEEQDEKLQGQIAGEYTEESEPSFEDDQDVEDDDENKVEEPTFAEFDPAADDLVVDDPELQRELEACEPENWKPVAQQLARENVPLMPPEEITDEALAPILWELIHNLSLRSFYLLHTDHLSDRELYCELWKHGLREPALLIRNKSYGGWFYDFLGGGTDAQQQAWLRFYADPDGRKQHAADYPQDKIPPREKPPYNRDWRLPKSSLG